MAKELGTKCRLCRRAGKKLFLKGDRCVTPKCAVTRKPYGPGAHGASKQQRRGASEYGKQFAEKQKLKRMYGISERQLRKYLEEAKKKTGVFGDNLLERLESRLDNIVYRMGLATSRRQARQIVSHGFFKVEGKSLNIPSAKIKSGWTVEVKNTKMGKNYVKEAQTILKKRQDAPGWISFDAKEMKGKVLSSPITKDINAEVDVPVIIEFYSR